jgi:integrase
MAAKGWFRRKQQKLVYVWQVENPATGKKLERSKVIGDAVLSDEEGWQIVGAKKDKGELVMIFEEPSEVLTFSQVASYYLGAKEWRKHSTKELHTQIVDDVLVPRWGNQAAVKIKPRQIKVWLTSLIVEGGTRDKYKTVMGTVYKFAQCEGLLPLGEQYNPVHYVTGIGSASDYEPVVLTPEQTLKVLQELEQPEYTMVVLVAATGIRASEMLGLRWRDILWERSEIRIKQTYVHGYIQQGAKTRLSKSCVIMHPVLAQLLKDWRAESTHAQDGDFVFASTKLDGDKPRCGSMVVEDYLRPAAKRAGIIEVKDGRTYVDGEFAKRFGFHTFRHSLTSWLMSASENPQIVRAMLRWTNLNMLAHYAHSFQSDKLEAQGSVLAKLVPPGNALNREPDREPEEGEKMLRQ